MKNFSEVTAIDTANQLLVAIKLVEHDNPVYSFTVNGMPVTDEITVDLLSPIHFKCTVESGAIDIAKISINGREVMPYYLHASNPATSWVTDNWELQIQQPFYVWYHTITGQGWFA